jgi:ribosomal protein L2
VIAGSESNGAATSEQRGTQYLISAVEHQIYGWQPSPNLTDARNGATHPHGGGHGRTMPELDPEPKSPSLPGENRIEGPSKRRRRSVPRITKRRPLASTRGGSAAKAMLR